MKKIYSLIICLLIQLTIANAQNDSLERTIQNGYYTDYNYAVKDSVSNVFYVGFNASDSLGASYGTYITAINEDGTAAWLKVALDNRSDGGRVNKILQVSDSDIVLAGYMYVCDVWSGYNCIQKVSRLTGDTIWIKKFDFFSDQFGTDIVELADSGFWLAFGGALYRLNSTGDSLTYISYNYGQILKMLHSPSGNIILGCANGLLKIDTAGNVLNSLQLPNPISLLSSYRDSLYFAVGGKIIYKVDSLFNLIAVDSTFYNTPEINSLVVFDDSLWVLHHENANNLSTLDKSDFNFGNMSQQIFSDFNSNQFDARDLFVNNHSFELLAREHTIAGSFHLLLKNWINATDSAYHYNTDVGVASFYADSSYAMLDSISPGLYLVNPKFDLYVNVKNYGQTPVNEVFLNLVIDTGVIWCTTFVFGNHFSGFNIQPGDSANVHLGWIRQPEYISSSNPNNQLNICVWTSSPNNRMDYDHTNDNICQTVVLKNFVGINEIQNNDGISISPNPATTQLNINSKTKLIAATIKIIDFLGNSIIEKNAETNSTFNIELNNLPPGLYFIRINAGGKSWVKKFLKM